MKKCDQSALGAAPRITFENLRAVFAEPRQFCVQIINFVADVRQSFTATLNESSHGAVGTDRFQQLDPRLTDWKKSHGHALIFDRLSACEFESQHFPVEAKRFLERIDRNSQMIESHSCSFFAIPRDRACRRSRPRPNRGRARGPPPGEPGGATLLRQRLERAPVSRAAREVSL